MEEALARREELNGRELFVTRDGVLVGSNWIGFSKPDQQKAGMLVRREEISQLHARIKQIDKQIDAAQSNIAKLREQRHFWDETVLEQRARLTELRSCSSELHGQLGREETAWQESLNRIQALGDRNQHLADKIEASRQELEQTRKSLNGSLSNVEDRRRQQEAMLEKSRSLDEIASRKLSDLNRGREEFHEARLGSLQMTSELATTEERLERLNKDREFALEQLDELAFAEATRKTKVGKLKNSLEQLLERKSISGQELTKSKNRISDLDSQVSAAHDQHKESGRRVENCREALTQQDMKKQEIRVLHDQHIQSMQANGFSVDEIRANLPRDASLEEWEGKLQDTRVRVEKIGPVNLVAIQEFEELSEREAYLNSQHADLTEALSTLESVIGKIDRESRTRFKQTFDKINSGFNRFFPELFGGGKADLLLVTEDLLTAGITVMARPPGKRNSHIHLLSGGEKALTAVALLFALFELNPAPFCMLDEVDAPLDDANVGRYCETLKKLANNSQLIVVTHNKITMESMDRLLGVTMEESGVSRIVSVDVGQAVEMAVG